MKTKSIEKSRLPSKSDKKLNGIKTMHDIRDQLSLEIMNMSFEEEKAYLKKILSQKTNSL